MIYYMVLDNLPPTLKSLFHDHRVALGAAVVMGLLLVVSLVNLILFFIPKEGTVITQHAAVSGLKQPDIASWHLFGAYESSLSDLPKTMLQLNLEGVVAAKGVRPSWALIGVASGTSQAYRVGQTVPGGASIRNILKDRVILEHNGKLETLQLPVPVLQFGPMPEGDL